MQLRAAGVWVAFLAMSAALLGCGGGLRGTMPTLPSEGGAASAPSTKIKHVIIVIQENRSFDNFFATFPGADGTTTGNAAADRKSVV